MSTPPPAHETGPGETGGREPLTVTQAAALLGVSRFTIHRQIRTGRLPAVQVGTAVRIMPDDWARYLEAVRIVAPDDGDADDAPGPAGPGDDARGAQASGRGGGRLPPAWRA